jgi:hypothetical protein
MGRDVGHRNGGGAFRLAPDAHILDPGAPTVLVAEHPMQADEMRGIKLAWFIVRLPATASDFRRDAGCSAFIDLHAADRTRGA